MTVLSQEQRTAALDSLISQRFDVLIIGGGVTGAGIALDAASRGLSTAIIEGQDWASGCRTAEGGCDTKEVQLNTRNPANKGVIHVGFLLSGSE